MKPKRKAKPFLVRDLELFLNAPDGCDQHKIIIATVQHRLAHKAITIEDILDAAIVSESASCLPFSVVAQELSDLTGEDINPAQLIERSVKP